MNNKSLFIVLALIGCFGFNYIAQSGGSPLLLLLGQVLYFFSLYKISVLSGESGWFAVFGILNIFGLVIVLLIPKFKNKHTTTN